VLYVVRGVYECDGEINLELSGEAQPGIHLCAAYVPHQEINASLRDLRSSSGSKRADRLS